MKELGFEEKIKAKKEQHNAVLDKIDAILEAGIVEVRGLTEVENTEVEELIAEANALRLEIEEGYNMKRCFALKSNKRFFMGFWCGWFSYLLLDFIRYTVQHL